jgi:diketogulonate reductase-like aldo/keto reductase
MAESTPSFPLRGGGSIPCTGMGTVSVTAEGIASGLRAGYRLIDTALLYANHAEVRAGMALSGVPREEIFLLSKVAFFPQDATESLWMYNPNNVKGNEMKSIDQCLEELGVEYLDLLLVHNPCVSVAEYNASCCPHFFELKGAEGGMPATLPNGHRLRELVAEAEYARCSAIDRDASREARRCTWARLEQAKGEGKCRHLGVSNYNAELLTEMKGYASELPVINELELHPRFSSPKVQEVRNNSISYIIYLFLNLNMLC